MMFKIRMREWDRIWANLPNINEYQGDYFNCPVEVGPDVIILNDNGTPLDPGTEPFIRFIKRPSKDPLADYQWATDITNGIEADGEWVKFHKKI